MSTIESTTAVFLVATYEREPAVRIKMDEAVAQRVMKLASEGTSTTRTFFGRDAYGVPFRIEVGTEATRVSIEPEPALSAS